MQFTLYKNFMFETIAYYNSLNNKIDNKLNFLPQDQKKFLESLVIEAMHNEPCLKGIDKICSIIYQIESYYPDKGQEILKGAHVIIKDQGQLAKEIKAETSNQTRFSSHHKLAKIKEFGVDIHPTHELLVGETDSYTFWQLERTKVRYWTDLYNNILHLYDYFEYKITGKNIGPLGSSDHTESNPLVINYEEDSIFSNLNLTKSY
jgi:hypothetical protein